MGYRISQRSTKFFIAKELADEALAAIKELAKKPDQMTGFAVSGGEVTDRFFGWVNTDKFVQAKTLVEALRAWRWEAEEDEVGNIIDLHFLGEKLGDDDTLFDAIAPFVRSGSFVTIHGEDGYIWQWTFEEGRLSHRTGEVVFS